MVLATNKTIQATLVVGGCRSGKSHHAIHLAEQYPGKNKVYVATCVPMDEEMRHRVRRHQAERGEHWRTAETPLSIRSCIERESAQADVILVDCLTLWISNLMGEGNTQGEIIKKAEALGRTLETLQCPVVLVSNEVGAGIVPENPMAREYRDTAGWVNQVVGRACTRVVWTVAGIPVTIK
jgi:adenosylcobinamide kinase/adenosylcobinamide-phosphate guanylyltransferase